MMNLLTQIAHSEFSVKIELHVAGAQPRSNNLGTIGRDRSTNCSHAALLMDSV